MQEVYLCLRMMLATRQPGTAVQPHLPPPPPTPTLDRPSGSSDKRPQGTHRHTQAATTSSPRPALAYSSFFHFPCRRASPLTPLEPSWSSFWVTWARTRSFTSASTSGGWRRPIPGKFKHTKRGPAAAAAAALLLIPQQEGLQVRMLGVVSLGPGGVTRQADPRSTRCMRR